MGLDELGARLLGTPDAVELPRPARTFEANGTAFRVHKRDADVRVLSPVDGEVVETGGADRGWYLKRQARGQRRAGIPSSAARRGNPAVADARNGAAATGARGTGRRSPRWPMAVCRWRISRRSYPQADWDAVCGEMFLEP